MKQHITLKQWDELTKDQKNTLHDFDFINDWKMNIGQMIEFLGDDLDFIRRRKSPEGYIYFEVYFQKNNQSATSRFSYDELADALWEAVKFKFKQ